jgi:hypothetical protein
MMWKDLATSLEKIIPTLKKEDEKKKLFIPPPPLPAKAGGRRIDSGY